MEEILPIVMYHKGIEVAIFKSATCIAKYCMGEIPKAKAVGRVRYSLANKKRLELGDIEVALRHAKDTHKQTLGILDYIILNKVEGLNVAKHNPNIKAIG